jgi:hypothetical protein
VIANFSIIQHRLHRKQHIQRFFFCCMRICCCNVFTEQLPSSDDMYRCTDWWEGFMKYAIKIGSRTMICIPNFTKIYSGIQKLIWEEGFTDTAWWSYKPTHSFSLLSLFWKNKSRLVRSLCYLCVCESPPTLNFWIPEPVFMKQGMYRISWKLTPISTAYFINPSISLCVCMGIVPIVARHRLGKHVPVATDRTTEELGTRVCLRIPFVVR